MIIGVAFARYFDLTLRMFSESMRQAQVTGCLDAMLSSQSGCVPIVLMSSLYSLISGGVQLVIILVAGVAFGIHFGINIPATFVVFILYDPDFREFRRPVGRNGGVAQEGRPDRLDLERRERHSGRSLFPRPGNAAMGPKDIFLLPITYSLDALRLTMLRNCSIAMVAKPVSILAIMTAILLPASIMLFAGAVRKGRKEGTLTEY